MSKIQIPLKQGYSSASIDVDAEQGETWVLVKIFAEKELKKKLILRYEPKASTPKRDKICIFHVISCQGGKH